MRRCAHPLHSGCRRYLLAALVLGALGVAVPCSRAQQHFVAAGAEAATTGTGALAPASPAASLPAPDASAARPTAAEILTRTLEHDRARRVALDHYESDRTYRVEYSGTGGHHLAEIHVHAEYTGQPDGAGRKHLTITSESGSKFLCDKVLRKLVEAEQEASSESNRMQSTLSPENYDAQLMGEETVAVAGAPGERASSVMAWVLDVTPRVDNKFTYRGRVWISERDYAVIRIEAAPGKNPSWWINRAAIDSRYLRRGEMWLPASNVSSSHVRIGGEAMLTIDYGSYPVVLAHAVRPQGPVTAEARIP